MFDGYVPLTYNDYVCLCPQANNGHRKEFYMIKSMTGFGRAELVDEEKKITVEMKSVNHRYLDINMRMPKKLSFFEAAIRNLREIAQQYLTYLREMGSEFGLETEITAAALSKYPEVFTMEEQAPDEKELWTALEQVIRSAAGQFVESRTQEGAHLRQDILEKLKAMDKKVDLVEKRSPEILQEYREKLEVKVKELLADTQIEESRIAAEVILFADKICTDEETVRLKSHIHRMEEVLHENEGIGRKLDFIAQEMNREANTILSKANDLETSNLAIDLKTEIEKVREQIQNIE